MNKLNLFQFINGVEKAQDEPPRSVRNEPTCSGIPLFSKFKGSDFCDARTSQRIGRKKKSVAGLNFEIKVNE